MDDLIDRMRELAEELVFAHCEQPPVDPFVLAECLDVTVVREGLVARWIASSSEPTEKPTAATVYLPPELSAERARFTLAHELMEIVAAQASPPLLFSREQANRAEHLFQLGASELLMPRRWFEAEGVRSEWDLDRLRRTFGVSWEAAARRVPLVTPAVYTIVDNGSISGRAGAPGLQFPRQPAAEEREAIAAAYEAWPDPGPARRAGPGFRCEAWPALPEKNRVRRVCLLTYLTEE